MTSAAQARAETSMRRHLRLGTAVIVLLLVGLGGWAALADISGAVIASGVLVVESSVKKVQHPSGGIVGELRVREGDHVQAGDILVRLDETLTQANLAIASKALDEMTARRARLEAERNDRDSIEFPQALLDRRQQPEVRALMEREQRAFEIGRVAREGEKEQLREQIAQATESIEGYGVRERAKAEEIVLIERELKGIRELWSKNLIPISKLTALEREATRLEGERGQLMSLMAETKGKIAETELKILQVDRDLRDKVGQELREVEAKIGELVERKVAAEDQLKRVDIRAPQSGQVHQLSVHTIGGVITAGEPILLIVPHDDELRVEVKVKPSDIDQLQLGQTATLRFSAFNQRNTLQINGSMSRISADIATDERTGANYYTVRIALSDEELARLGSLKLVPGMPVEAFIKTEDRKVISYLMKPLTDQMQRAFRDN